uniref:Uncharacterized protein n=1 Tax=Faecalibaculum rodentium TaxID=1702221 RepID=A0A140DUC0_9FIRM|nr:hypothetical protein AALO17_11130 [Faecalibaculum rodentium]
MYPALFQQNQNNPPDRIFCSSLLLIPFAVPDSAKKKKKQDPL